jgi:hypothetical protein
MSGCLITDTEQVFVPVLHSAKLLNHNISISVPEILRVGITLAIEQNNACQTFSQDLGYIEKTKASPPSSGQSHRQMYEGYGISKTLDKQVPDVALILTQTLYAKRANAQTV